MGTRIRLARRKTTFSPKKLLDLDRSQRIVTTIPDWVRQLSIQIQIEIHNSPVQTAMKDTVNIALHSRFATDIESHI